MPIPAIVEKVEDAPEAFRSEYQQGQDGKFYLQVAPISGWALEDVGGLKRANQELGQKHKAAADGLAAYAKLGAPEEIGEKLGKFDELSKLDPTKQADELAQKKLGEWKSTIQKEHAKEVERLTGELSAVQRGLHREIVIAKLTGKLAAAKGDADLLMPHLEKRLRPKPKSEGSDEYVLEVLDEDGKSPGYDDQGNPATIDWLITDARKRFPRAFEGENQAGSGAGGSGAGGSSRQAGEKTTQQRIVAGLKELGIR